MAVVDRAVDQLILDKEQCVGGLSICWDYLVCKILCALHSPGFRHHWRKCRSFSFSFFLLVSLVRQAQGVYPYNLGKLEPPTKFRPFSRAGARPDPGKRATDGAGVPCVYEGHLQTEKNWYGYLANISVRTTGQLSFEFAYPADRCCQNILFYLEDQMPLLSARMNCWQREYLLRPEDDQILRLTPSFSWSGCHLTKHDGIDMFVCKGGRSFSVDTVNGRLTTWYIAVSNCAILHGLDLLYRLEIYGHVGECSQPLPKDRDTTTTVVAARNPAVKASLTPREANTRQLTDTELCIFQGSINTTNPWFGFIRNLSLNSGGGFRFMFTYPYSMQIQNVILYSEDDIKNLTWELSCWDKEAIITSPMVPKQIIDMSFRSSWNGCSSNYTGLSRNLTCVGHRIFDSARKVFLAVSNCRSFKGLQLHYRLEVFGYSDACSAATALISQFVSYEIPFRWTASTLLLMLLAGSSRIADALCLFAFITVSDASFFGPDMARMLPRGSTSAVVGLR